MALNWPAAERQSLKACSLCQACSQCLLCGRAEGLDGSWCLGARHWESPLECLCVCLHERLQHGVGCSCEPGVELQVRCRGALCGVDFEHLLHEVNHLSREPVLHSVLLQELADTLLSEILEADTCRGLSCVPRVSFDPGCHQEDQKHRAAGEDVRSHGIVRFSGPRRRVLIPRHRILHPGRALCVLSWVSRIGNQTPCPAEVDEQTDAVSLPNHILHRKIQVCHPVPVERLYSR
mmetsp:Transcript_15307/g.31028  ORF Transcript_15307/g.31028 Transcript_15307/m.31028 type:complete len:235 (-) Transcript_15307:408-1112(-)